MIEVKGQYFVLQAVAIEDDDATGGSDPIVAGSICKLIKGKCFVRPAGLKV